MVMRRDFTLETYRTLCKAILENNITPMRLCDYISSSRGKKKVAIIRHDVDKKPENALKMAEMERSLGIKATYYFRTTKEVYHKKIIMKINEMGHEIGYHYEVLAKAQGDKKKAIVMFEKELQELRTLVPVKTICMHGSPWSKWKDSDLWEDYDYSDYNIIAEAFLTLDYNTICYYTDTGRRWDGGLYNVRDKVKTNLQSKEVRSTYELIETLPTLMEDISLNSHPQRWHDSYSRWLLELVGQNIKNIGKKYFLKSRNQ